MLLQNICVLHQAGAEFAAIASNTPRIVFKEIAAKSPIPLVSIVESTCARAQEMGLKNIGLMGTKPTMEADFYQQPFAANGISIIVPAEQQLFIHEKLFSEIELGIFKDSTREELLAIVTRMVDAEGIGSLILGSAELPLLLTGEGMALHF